MNREQLDHYLLGGKFRAIYEPKTKDVRMEDMEKSGTKIIVYQNMLNTPIIDSPKWLGQFRFNSNFIYGWFPEEDIHDLEIVKEYKSAPEPDNKYLYKMTYTNDDQIVGNFGRDTNLKLPFCVSRESNTENDRYFINLSDPPATTVEKTLWKSNFIKDLQWEVIFTMNE